MGPDMIAVDGDLMNPNSLRGRDWPRYPKGHIKAGHFMSRAAAEAFRRDSANPDTLIEVAAPPTPERAPLKPGRAKKLVDVREEISRLSNGAREYLRELNGMAHGERGTPPSQRIKALELLVAYAYGKPVTPTQTSATVDVTHRIGPEITDDDLREMLADAPDERDDADDS